LIHTLYIKQHNQTFLKYLGYTSRDPYRYKGSGKYWKRHLKTHGNNVDTYIIGTYETKEKLKEAGIYYSHIWNVVESNEWANFKPEEGDGGFTFINTNNLKSHPFIDLTKQRFGNWTVLFRLPNNHNRKTMWSCQCDCGNIYEVIGESLTSNKSLQCRICQVRQPRSQYRYRKTK
jgi:hypothetical protein